MENEENKHKKLEETVGDWVIVHGKQHGQKDINVGKLTSVDTNVIFLDVFHGSFEKGCLPSSLSIPYNSIKRIYNKEIEIVYKNLEYKK